MQVAAQGLHPAWAQQEKAYTLRLRMTTRHAGRPATME